MAFQMGKINVQIRRQTRWLIRKDAASLNWCPAKVPLRAVPGGTMGNTYRVSHMWPKNLPHNISLADGRRVRSSPRQPDPIAAKNRSITASRERSYSVVNARCLTNDRWSECPAASAHTSATRAMHWGQSIRAERLARISQNEDYFIEKSFEKPVIKSGSRLV